MSTVFISHAAEDAGFAARLSNDLRKMGYNPQTAAGSSPSRRAGDEPERERASAVISKVDVFVPVLSPASINSEQFLGEVKAAVSTETPHDVKVVPIMARACDVPDILTLRTPTDFTASYREALKHFVDRLSASSHREAFQNFLADLRQSSSERPHYWLRSHDSTFAQDLYTKLLAVWRDDRRSTWSLSKAIAEILSAMGSRVSFECSTEEGRFALVAVGFEYPGRPPEMLQFKWDGGTGRLGVEIVDTVNPIRQTGRLLSRRHVFVCTSRLVAFGDDPPSFTTWSGSRSDRWELQSSEFHRVSSWLAAHAYKQVQAQAEYYWLPNQGEIPPPARTDEAEPSLEAPAATDALAERYSALVDKKLLYGLSENEQNEIAALEEQLDEAESRFYEPIKKTLRAERDRLMKTLLKTDHEETDADLQTPLAGSDAG